VYVIARFSFGNCNDHPQQLQICTVLWNEIKFEKHIENTVAWKRNSIYSVQKPRTCYSFKPLAYHSSHSALRLSPEAYLTPWWVHGHCDSGTQMSLSSTVPGGQKHPSTRWETQTIAWFLLRQVLGQELPHSMWTMLPGQFFSVQRKTLSEPYIIICWALTNRLAPVIKIFSHLDKMFTKENSENNW